MQGGHKSETKQVPDLHLMNLLLQLRGDALLARHHCVQVPPPPPLAGHRHGHQHGVDRHGGGGGEQGDAGQGGHQERQGVGARAGLGWGEGRFEKGLDGQHDVYQDLPFCHVVSMSPVLSRDGQN